MAADAAASKHLRIASGFLLLPHRASCSPTAADKTRGRAFDVLMALIEGRGGRAFQERAYGARVARPNRRGK